MERDGPPLLLPEIQCRNESSTYLDQKGKEMFLILELKGLFVFQGEMGAPGAHGNKGEKVAIRLL